jgi:hypothetical protein
MSLPKAEAAKVFSALTALAVVLSAFAIASVFAIVSAPVSAVSCDNDSVCDAGENPLWCANDCAAAYQGYCGDGFYDINEQGNCPADAGGASCTPTNGGVELCDEADNDCDGLIDEGLPLICKWEPIAESKVIPDSASQAFKIIISNPNNDPLLIKWLDGAAEVQDGNKSYVFVANPALGGEHTIKVVVNNTNTSEVSEKNWQLNVTTTYYRDSDSDGYGDANSTIIAAGAPAGYVSDSADCNDSDAAVNPGETEIAYNGKDDDCNALTKDDDLDGDSYLIATDCDDTNSAINPGAAEVCDGIDNNCASGADEGLNVTQLNGSKFAITIDANQDSWPSVAFGDSGSNKFLVVWHSNRTGVSNIYGQFVSLNGSLIGSAFAIDSSPTYEVAATAEYDSDNDKWLVVWEDGRDSATLNRSVYGRFVNADGSFAGTSFRITSGPNDEFSPVAVSMKNSSFLVVWEDSRTWELTDCDDVYSQIVDINGSLIGSETVISNLDWCEGYPDVAYDPVNNRALVAWEDPRADGGFTFDIYGQFVAPDGSLSGGNFALMNDSADQYRARIEYNSKDGDYLALAREGNAPPNKVRAQKIAADGSKIGASLLINDGALSSIPNEFVTVAYNSVINKYLAIWADNNATADGSMDVFSQIMTAAGGKEGANFLTAEGIAQQRKSSVASGANQDFLIVWQEGLTTDIWAQLVTGACG